MAMYCDAKCQRQHYATHKTLCDKVRAKDWYQKATVFEDEWGSFRSMEGQLKNWTRIHRGTLKIQTKEQGEDEWTLQTLINAYRQNKLPRRQRVYLGEGKAGRVERIVFNAQQRDEWAPSIVVKVSTFHKLHPLYEKYSPFVDLRAEVNFTAGFFQHLYYERVCPHVPIYYGHVELPDSIMIVSDFAHFGTLYGYIKSIPKQKRQPVIDTFLMQLLYTLDIMQQVVPNFRHNDLHVGNILVRAYDFEGQSRYITERGVFFLPNIGAQCVIADFDWASAGGEVENFTTMNHFMTDITDGINYEEIPGADAYRVVAGLYALSSVKSGNTSPIVRRILLMYNQRGIVVNPVERIPKNAIVWRDMPTPRELLDELIPLFTSQSNLPLKETFDGSRVKRRGPVEFPMSFPENLYHRVLPLEKPIPGVPRAYLEAPIYSHVMDDLELPLWNKSMLRRWFQQDTQSEKNLPKWIRYVWTLYEKHASKFNLARKYHALIGYAMYVHTLLRIHMRYDSRKVTVAVSYDEWEDRLAEATPFDLVSAAMDECLFLWYRILQSIQLNEISL
jgi:hypothetical protein